jgi:hypothetical protein
MRSLSYWRFALENRRFLTFGFFVAFASSFGQTYFIGIFSPSIQLEFGLTHTAWATTYLMGTLATQAAFGRTARAPWWFWPSAPH